MAKQAEQLVEAPDWGELLLEIQTTPGTDLTDSHAQLYDGIYGALQVCAQRWLSRHRLSESRDGELVAIGLDKLFRDITKFDIPDDSSEGVRKAFFAWTMICCEREWSKQEGLMLEKPLSLVENDKQYSPPSPEDIWIDHENSSEPPPRSVTDRALKERILNEELNKLIPAMEEAILESEDIKSVKNPNARGESGAAVEIASRHGFTAGAVRTARSRLLQRVKERFQQEAKS